MVCAQDQQEGAGPNEISSLVQDAQLIAGTVKSPDDVMRALNENEEFVKAVKKVVCDYVRSAIVGAEIPTIEATKDWGEYTIAELQVVDLDLDPEKLELLVKQSVHVKVRGNFAALVTPNGRLSAFPRGWSWLSGV
jgi:hypothetical protein